MTLSVDELGIRVVLILCTRLLSIQTTQQSPFLHNQGKFVWMFCDCEIRVSTSGLKLEFSPPQLNALPLSYDAPWLIWSFHPVYNIVVKKVLNIYYVLNVGTITIQTLLPNDNRDVSLSKSKLTWLFLNTKSMIINCNFVPSMC